MDKGKKQNTALELVEQAVRALQKQGVVADVRHADARRKGAGADALVRVGHGGRAVIYTVQVKRWLRPNTLGVVLQGLHRVEGPVLLVADHVTPQMAERLRDLGVNFVDTAGNAFLDQPPMLVWVKGERPERQAAEVKAPKLFQVGGLKVLFALLCNPEWVTLPYRELGKLAGVAHGTVGQTMAGLVEEALVVRTKGKRRFMADANLLRQWSEGYARTLRPKLVMGRFAPANQEWWRGLQPLDYGLLLGGEPAAARLTRALKPGTVTLYGQGIQPRLVLDNRLRKDPVGQVEVLRRFWEFEHPWDHPGLTPPLLIYADLLAIADSRTLETAKIIYDRYLAGHLKNH